MKRSYLLLAILFAAALLRFYQIDQPFTDSISWRQSDTATIADNFYRGNWNIFYPEISWNGPEHNYVGYEFQTVTYITALLYRLVGQHDWVGRSVAALFGLWSIFALYQLVCCVWTEKHALVSAAVLAIFPGSIYVDRALLPDPVMISLVITSFWLLVTYLQTERLHYLVLASLIGMLGFLTKITGIFIGIPMLYAIITILNRKRMLLSKQLTFTCVAAVIMLIPVIAYYYWAHHVSLTYPPHHIAASGNWLWNDGLNKWWEQKYFLLKLYRHLKNLWTYPLMILVAVGLFLRPPQDASTAQYSFQAPWLFHYWIIAVVFYYFIGAKELVDNPHNLNIIHAAAATLAGNALISIASFTRQISGVRGSVAALLTIVLIVAGISNKNLNYLTGRFYPNYIEEGYKLGVALHQVTQPNDLVITIGPEIGNPLAIYYSQRRGWVFPPAWKGVVWWADDDINNNSKAIRLLEELRAKGAGWLGIVNQQKIKLWKRNSKLVEYIEQTFELNQESSDYVIYRIVQTK